MSEVAVRQEDLDVYNALAAQYNEVTKPKFEMLKLLNKEGREGFGEWWLGRKYEGRQVSVPGEKVKAIVIIDHYGQYSYYDQATNSNLCHSPMFRSYPNGVRGSKFGFECGPKCPHRQGKKPCKAQRVVFAIALTEEGDKIPCQYYVKGSGYMPFMEYVEKSSSMVMNGKMIDLPTFAYVTELSAKEQSNGDTIYFAPVFKFASLIPVEKLKSFQDMADQVRSYVEEEIKAQEKKGDGQECAAPERVVHQSATPVREDMQDMDDMPWASGPTDPKVVGKEPDDVANLINSALGI